MSTLSDRRRWRWGVPLLAFAAVTGTTYVAALPVSAEPHLPDRSPGQLLVDLQRARMEAVSGTIVQTTDLGLPELPGLGIPTGSPLAPLLSGSHTWRVWYGGRAKVRVAQVTSFGETDVIRNGSDLWVWDSVARTAQRYRIPKDADDAADRASLLPVDPEQSARDALATLDPTTSVSTAKNVMVAGRPAYELVLTPKAPNTLVAGIRIAIDGERLVPLRFQVMSTKRPNAAFEVGFTEVSFDRPEDRQFEFTPPPGTEVTDTEQAGQPTTSPTSSGSQSGTSASARPAPAPSAPAQSAPARSAPAQSTPARSGLAHPTKTSTSPTKVVGHGWASVIVTSLDRVLPNRLPGSPQELLLGSDGPRGGSMSRDELRHTLRQFPRVSGRWGQGHLFEGTLFSVLLTDDGRFAVGAVPAAQLYTALEQK